MSCSISVYFVWATVYVKLYCSHATGVAIDGDASLSAVQWIVGCTVCIQTTMNAAELTTAHTTSSCRSAKCINAPLQGFNTHTHTHTHNAVPLLVHLLTNVAFFIAAYAADQAGPGSAVGRRGPQLTW